MINWCAAPSRDLCACAVTSICPPTTPTEQRMRRTLLDLQLIFAYFGDLLVSSSIMAASHLENSTFKNDRYVLSNRPWAQGRRCMRCSVGGRRRTTNLKTAVAKQTFFFFSRRADTYC